jgi:hypothetical protein
MVCGGTAIALGVFLVKQGLQDADRWASVIGLFLNAVGLGLTVYSLHQSRRTTPAQEEPVRDKVTNRIGGGTFDQAVVMARDIDQTPGDTPRPAPPAGEVDNTVENGAFHGPVIMARDIRGPLPGTDPTPR